MERRLYVWTLGDLRFTAWDRFVATLDRIDRLCVDIRLLTFGRMGVESRSADEAIDRQWQLHVAPHNPWWPVDELMTRRELGYDTLVAWFVAGGDTLTHRSIRAAHHRGLEVWTCRQQLGRT